MKTDTLFHSNTNNSSIATDVVAQASDFYAQLQEKARYMFGYPAYHAPLSERTQALLAMHYAAPFSNNCGDIDERGN